MRITVLRDRDYETDIDVTVDVQLVERDDDLPSVTVYGVRDANDGSRFCILLDAETVQAIAKAGK